MILKITALLFVAIFCLHAEDDRYFFDRFYTFGGFNLQSEDSDNYNKWLIGVLVKRNLYLEGIDLQGSVSTVLKNNTTDDGKNSFNIGFKEVYIKKSIGDMQISIGREIIDLSVAKVHSVLDYMSIAKASDPYDRSLDVVGLDGANIGYFFEDYDLQLLLYAYERKNDLNDKKDWQFFSQSKYTIDDLDLNLFIGSDNANELLLGLGSIFVINDYLNVYLELNRIQDNINTVAGIDYSYNSNLSTSIEVVSKKGQSFSGVVDTHLALALESNATNNEIKGNIANYMQNNLIGSEYINFIARLETSSVFTYSILTNYNLDDDSFRAILQANMDFENVKLFSQFVRNEGSKQSEFGNAPNYIAQFKIAYELQ